MLAGMRAAAAVLILWGLTACPDAPGPKAPGMPWVKSTAWQRYPATAVQVLQAGSYTYVKVRPDVAPERWVVGLHTDLATGQTVYVRAFGKREDFCSQRLGRCFETLEFAFLGLVEKP